MDWYEKTWLDKVPRSFGGSGGGGTGGGSGPDANEGGDGDEDGNGNGNGNGNGVMGTVRGMYNPSRKGPLRGIGVGGGGGGGEDDDDDDGNAEEEEEEEGARNIEENMRAIYAHPGPRIPGLPGSAYIRYRHISDLFKDNNKNNNNQNTTASAASAASTLHHLLSTLSALATVDLLHAIYTLEHRLVKKSKS